MEPRPIQPPPDDDAGDPLPSGNEPGSEGARRRGARERADEMLVLLYEEMRRIASSQMRSQPAHHTLQATALVHEAFIRLASRKTGAPEFEDGDRFLALAASAMRSVLVDNARAKNRIKRRPQGKSVPLEDVTSGYEHHAIDLVALDDALERLAQIDELMVSVVELRFFGGLDNNDVGRVLGLKPERVEAEWKTARAWLRGELE